MRKLLLTASLAALLPAGAALAQVSVPTDQPAGATEIDTTTVAETPEGDYSPPAATVPPVRDMPPGSAQPGATPDPDGVIRQWGPQQAVIENVPPAAGSYPMCNAQRQDSCKNPDPSKELPYYPGDDRPGA